MTELVRRALAARWDMGRALHAKTTRDIDCMDATELSVQGAEELVDAVHYLRRVDTPHMQDLADRALALLGRVPAGILRQVARRADAAGTSGDVDMSLADTLSGQSREETPCGPTYQH